jgi:hypothetical protein
MGMDEGYTTEHNNARSNSCQMITHSSSIRMAVPEPGQTKDVVADGILIILLMNNDLRRNRKDCAEARMNLLGLLR